MPEFHHMMGERLRSVEQGADTVVWLAVSRAAARTRSGQFFQGERREIWLSLIQSSPSCAVSCFDCIADRKPVHTHLPLAWTHSSTGDVEGFLIQLETLAKVIQSQPEPPEFNPPLAPSTPDFV